MYIKQSINWLKRSQNLISFLILALFIFLRALLRGVSLWSWDDVEFVWQVEHGNWYAHAPGFPGYIVLGRLFYSICMSFTGDVHAEGPMLLLSALLAGATIIPLFYLTKHLFSNQAATFLVATFFAISPDYWFWGTQSYSDISATFFFLSSLALCKLGLVRKDPKLLLASMLTFGYGVEIRLTHIILLPALLVMLIQKERGSAFPSSKKGLAFILTALVSSSVGYLCILCSMGWEKWLKYITQYNEVNIVPLTAFTLLSRSLTLINHLIMGSTYPIFILFPIGLLFVCKNKKNSSLLLTWIVPYAAFFLCYGPNFSRFYLPILPAIILLSAYGLVNIFDFLKRKLKSIFVLKFIITCIILLLALYSAFPTYITVKRLHDYPSPGKQLALFINQVVPKNSVVIGEKYCWLLHYYTDVQIIWSFDQEYVIHCIDSYLSTGNHVFIPDDALQSYPYLSEYYTLHNYAKSPTGIMLLEIMRQ